MTFVHVKGIPAKFGKTDVVKKLARIIKGQFELIALRGKLKDPKECFLKLAFRLDPRRAVQSINTSIIGNHSLYAVIIDRLPTSVQVPKKTKKVPPRLARSLRIPVEARPDKIVVLVYSEIMLELQYKYSGLKNLIKSNYNVFKEIAQTVHNRLNSMVEKHPESLEGCFKFSKMYRKLHPHVTDLSLIASAVGAQGSQDLQELERELLADHARAIGIGDVPYDEVRIACNKYVNKIIQKMQEHIRNLKTEPTPTDTPEEQARKKVRTEFKNISFYLPQIVNKVTNDNFDFLVQKYEKMRIYGEPFLPDKESLKGFLKKFSAVRVIRSDNYYNMIRFDVPTQRYGSIMKLDGTIIGGNKMVIRSSHIPIFKVRPPTQDNTPFFEEINEEQSQDQEALEVDMEDF